MDNAPLVGIAQGGGHGLGHLQQRRPVQALLEALLERAPRQVFHGDVVVRVVVANIINGDNIGMTQVGHHLAFFQKPFGEIRVRR